MRGKKVDHDFVCSFIAESVEQGYDIPETILARAQNMIAEIDQQIIESEKAKLIRCKLLDVIEKFQKKV